jgi:hypothetical protein
LHQGFAGNLGLPVLTEEKKRVAKATSCTFYEWPPPSGTDGTKNSVESTEKRPYDVIRERVLTLLGKESTKNRLYMTGHSLGGADAAVFAGMFAYDKSTPDHKCMHLVTFGQPLVGDQDYAGIMKEYFEERYVRVVNHNDIVGRLPTFFLDTGRPFVHPAECSRLYINAEGILEAVDADAKDVKSFDRLIYTSWLKLKMAWHYLSRGTSDQQQSSMRFLVRAMLLPIMIINDHLDYKLLLNHQPQNNGKGYWQATNEACLPDTLASTTSSAPTTPARLERVAPTT